MKPIAPPDIDRPAYTALDAAIQNDPSRQDLLVTISEDLLFRRVANLNSTLSILHKYGYRVELTEHRIASADGRTLVQFRPTLRPPA